MSRPRIHPDHAMTPAERAQRCRDKKRELKKEAEKEFKRRSNSFDVRWEIFNMFDGTDLDAARKSLLKRLHPDHSGTDEQVKRFNRLWDLLTKEGKRYVTEPEMPKVEPVVTTKAEQGPAIRDVTIDCKEGTTL